MNSSRFLRSPDVGWREVDGLVFAVEPRTSTVHKLNSTAGEIWRYLSKPATLEQVSGRIRAEFDDCPPSVEEELENHIAEMLEKNLLVKL